MVNLIKKSRDLDGPIINLSVVRHFALLRNPKFALCCCAQLHSLNFARISRPTSLRQFLLLYFISGIVLTIIDP